MKEILIHTLLVALVVVGGLIATVGWAAFMWLFGRWSAKLLGWL